MEASLKWTASRPRQMQQLVRIAGSASCWRRTRYLWMWRARRRGKGEGGGEEEGRCCLLESIVSPARGRSHAGSLIIYPLLFPSPCISSIACTLFHAHTHTHTYTHTHARTRTHFSILLLFVFSDSRGARRRVAFSVNSRKIGVTSTKPVQIWVNG